MRLTFREAEVTCEDHRARGEISLAHCKSRQNIRPCYSPEVGASYDKEKGTLHPPIAAAARFQAPPSTLPPETYHRRHHGHPVSPYALQGARHGWRRGKGKRHLLVLGLTPLSWKARLRTSAQPSPGILNSR